MGTYGGSLVHGISWLLGAVQAQPLRLHIRCKLTPGPGSNEQREAYPSPRSPDGKADRGYLHNGMKRIETTDEMDAF